MGIFSDPFINWRRVRIYSFIAALIWAVSIAILIQENRPDHKRVVLLLFDGLRPDAIQKLGPKLAPNFYTLIDNGASTFNARTDIRSTSTLPNVISILTGRPVFDGEAAHKYTTNVYTGAAVHDYRDQYIESVFDVLYNNNMRSSFFAAKDKFGVFINSYTYEKNVGEKVKGKRDPARFQSYFISNTDDELTFEKFLIDFVNYDSHFIFLHLSGPDQMGHLRRWSLEDNSHYMNAVKKMDEYLGKIFDVIRRRQHLRDNVYLIVTADHGGHGGNHVDPFQRNNYMIPFFVWGPDIAKGVDLYSLNEDTRRNPKKRMVSFEDTVQPIRNSDAGNLALNLLDLPSIPGSVINALHSLRVKP